MTLRSLGAEVGFFGPLNAIDLDMDQRSRMFETVRFGLAKMEKTSCIWLQTRTTTKKGAVLNSKGLHAVYHDRYLVNMFSNFFEK